MEFETRPPPSLDCTGWDSMGWGMYSLAGRMVGEIPAAHHTRLKTCHPDSIYLLYRIGMA